MHTDIKKLIRDMCDESEELTPMAIHTRILRNHRRDKYKFTSNLIPCLKKVIIILSISLLIN